MTAVSAAAGAITAAAATLIETSKVAPSKDGSGDMGAAVAGTKMTIVVEVGAGTGTHKTANLLSSLVSLLPWRASSKWPRRALASSVVEIVILIN